MAEWIDLLDPSAEELRAALDRDVHDLAFGQLLEPTRHDDEPRPRLEGHDHYVFGVFVVPIAVREEDRVYYQELDLIATRERLVTVRKTPESGQAFDLSAAQESAERDDDKRAGLMVYRSSTRSRSTSSTSSTRWTTSSTSSRTGSSRGHPGRSASGSRRYGTTCCMSGAPSRQRVTRSGGSSTGASTSARGRRSCRATSNWTSPTSTTSCCARSTGSTSRATCSPARATTTRPRSRTTRTRSPSG